MIFIQRKRKSLILGLIIIISLFNLFISASNLDIFSTSSDRLLFFLATESEQRPVFILTFALHDLYEADEVRIDPEVAELLGITPNTPERVGGIEMIIIEPVIVSNTDSDALVYNTRDEVQIMFLDMESSKLLIGMRDNTIVVMGNDK